MDTLPRPGLVVAGDVQREVEQFLYRQAELLDGKHWQAFIDLFADDGVYWMPVTREQTEWEGSPSIFAEDKLMMEIRKGRVSHPNAWSQAPMWETNHLVSHVAIESASRDDDRGALALPHDGAQARRGAPLRRQLPPHARPRRRRRAAASGCSASTCSTRRRRSTTCCRSGCEPLAMDDRLVPEAVARRRRPRRVLRGVAVLAVLAAVVAAAGCGVLSQPQFGAPMSGARLERAKANPQYRDGRFVNVQPETPTSFGDIVGYIVRQFSGDEVRVPPAPLPVLAVDKTALAAAPPASGLRAFWIGHASVYVEVDGLRLLLDPVFAERVSPLPIGPKRFHPPPIALADLPPIDAVLVSHDHYDHLDMETVRALAARGTRFFVPLGIGAHLEHWGVPLAQIEEMEWWQRKALGGVEFVCTPTRHYSGRSLGDRSATLWSSWSVLGPQHRFFYSGDTGYSSALPGDRLAPRPVRRRLHQDRRLRSRRSHGSTSTCLPSSRCRPPRGAREADVSGPLVDLQPRVPRLGRADPPGRRRGAPHQRRAGDAEARRVGRRGPRVRFDAVVGGGALSARMSSDRLCYKSGRRRKER